MSDCNSDYLTSLTEQNVVSLAEAMFWGHHCSVWRPSISAGCSSLFGTLEVAQGLMSGNESRLANGVEGVIAEREGKKLV